MTLRISEHGAEGMEIQDISNYGDLTMVDRSVPHGCMFTLPPVAWWRESEGERRENSWVEINTVICTAKSAHWSKAKKGAHSLFSTARRVFSHPQESREPSCSTVTWEDKCYPSELAPLPPSSPSSTCWAWQNKLWNIHWVSRGHCPGCAPSRLLGHSQPPCCWGGVRSKKALMLCEPCSANMKNPHVINTCFMTNPKHSPTPAIRKKLNSETKSAQ